MAFRLTDEGINLIKQNTTLVDKVAAKLSVKQNSLWTMLLKPKDERSRRFTEYPCVVTIANETGVKPDSLIEEYAD